MKDNKPEPMKETKEDIIKSFKPRYFGVENRTSHTLVMHEDDVQEAMQLYADQQSTSKDAEIASLKEQIEGMKRSISKSEILMILNKHMSGTGQEFTPLMKNHLIEIIGNVEKYKVDKNTDLLYNNPKP